jgi:hypothetical protein
VSAPLAAADGPGPLIYHAGRYRRLPGR